MFPKTRVIYRIFTQYIHSIFKKHIYVGKILYLKFYMRGNNNKVDSVETGRKVIAHLLP